MVSRKLSARRILSARKRRERTSVGMPRDAALPASSRAVTVSGVPGVKSQGSPMSATRRPPSPTGKLGKARVPARASAASPPLRRNTTIPPPPCDTYWVAGLSFVTLKDKPSLNSLEEAAGKTIGVLQGGFSQRFLSQNAPQAVLKAYKGGPVETFTDLAIGRADAAFEDRDVAQYYLRTQPDRFRIGDKLFAQGEYAWAIRKEDGDLLEAANRFLAEAKRDGTIARLAKKWSIGPPVP